MNYDLPVKPGSREADCETYLHRIGRTGRFGKTGNAINIVEGRSDILILKEIEQHFSELSFVLVFMRDRRMYCTEFYFCVPLLPSPPPPPINPPNTQSLSACLSLQLHIRYIFSSFTNVNFGIAFQELEFTHHKMYISLSFVRYRVHSRGSEFKKLSYLLLIVEKRIAVILQRKIEISYHAYKPPAYKTCKNCTNKARNGTCFFIENNGIFMQIYKKKKDISMRQHKTEAEGKV